MNKIITIIPISSFNNSKTRLSPFLSKDERIKLLKCMLKDIVYSIQDSVYDIIVTSKDSDVLNYAKSLNLSIYKEKEHENNFLNNSLTDVISHVKNKYNGYSVLMLPADIPLISKDNIKYIINNKDDFIIAPSKGGGTNLLFIKDEYNFIPQFGEFSFFRHLDESKKHDMPSNIYDSFYLSLDINTPQDLGELLLHGTNTYTFSYLNSLNISVKNNHGQERLHVYRNSE